VNTIKNAVVAVADAVRSARGQNGEITEQTASGVRTVTSRRATAATALRQGARR
jgi:hypothetical protein